MQTPHESYWKAAKKILQYIRGTIQFGIHYITGGNPLLVGFTDSDWASDPDDQNSTIGYVFSLESGPVTWAETTRSFSFFSRSRISSRN